MPLIQFCHGNDNKGRLYGVDIRDIEIRSRFWNWGSAFREERDHLFIRGRSFPHLGWSGSPNLAWDTYRMHWEPVFELALWLQQLKSKDAPIYAVESGPGDFFELFNGRKQIHRSDLRAAAMTEEELAIRKQLREALPTGGPHAD